MARPPRDPRLRLDQTGQRPLLQGHLRRGGRPVSVQPPEPITPDPADDAGAKPSDEDGAGQPGEKLGSTPSTS